MTNKAVRLFTYQLAIEGGSYLSALNTSSSGMQESSGLEGI